MEDAITVVVIAGRAILARAVEGFTICGADGQNCDGAILLLRCAVAGSLDNAVLHEVQRRPADKRSSHWRVQANKKEGGKANSPAFILLASPMAALPVENH